MISASFSLSFYPTLSPSLFSPLSLSFSPLSPMVKIFSFVTSMLFQMWTLEKGEDHSEHREWKIIELMGPTELCSTVEAKASGIYWECQGL